ncbi:LAME_0E05336g1_1 [Lachancea meyersii CBS 8951]|uniref:LAME_0E05336g1_1 n=1 Tax=Lachancea meyersii CBS 8951 TaxID=1266667 RepID=A0A1G4JH83_9SACH|nr:LAME_0E05336g1_1 [Lachancea meyersii CBS 8951]
MPPPPSRVQLLSCFIGSNIVALGGGTPYLFSFYAPELLTRCKIPIAKSSTLSLSLTLGSGALGFVAGVVIDRKSPQVSCGIGAFCTFMAYLILRTCYVRQISSVGLISAALILIGFGSVSGYYASVKCCTTNFPRHRGTAGAFPVSLYALAGLLYSSLCARLFKDRMDAVFTFLMYTCSAMILTGCFTLRIHKPPVKVKRRTYSSIASDESSYSNATHAHSAAGTAPATEPINIQTLSSHRDSRGSLSNFKFAMKRSASRISSSTDSLLSFASSHNRSDSFIWAKELPGSLSFWGWGKARPTDSDNSRPIPKRVENAAFQEPDRSQVMPITPTDGSQAPRTPAAAGRRDSLLKFSPHSSPSQELRADGIDLEAELEHEPSFRDSRLYKSVTQPKFIAYYLILALLQGIGQTYIFSVGFVVEALAHSHPSSEINVKAIQSLQVSIISIMSFAGRICAGPVSDLLVKRAKAQREWCILIACGLMIYGSKQILADIVSIKVPHGLQSTDFIQNVSCASFIFGFAFGITFGTFPAIIADQFGTDGFSTIWGLFTTGGIATVKYFSAVFANDLSRNTSPGDTICDKGSMCYAHAFRVDAKFAVGVSLLSLVLITVKYVNKKSTAKRFESNGVFILDEDEDLLDD